jgi:uncharacterized phage-associated protein
MSNKIQLKFNESKTINAVLYIVENLRRKDFHKIFKILYFSDREHLNVYGRTITGDVYIAMTDGPVPSNLYDIFKSVRGDGYYKDDGKFGQYFSVMFWDLIKINTMPDLDELSKTDLTCIDNSLNKYGEMSWDEIREKSHDYAWRSTPQNRTIDFENIIREAGSEDDYIEYVKEQSLLVDLSK